MLRADPGQVPDKVGLGHRGQHRHAVLVALAAADEHLIRRQIHVLDSKSTALEHAETRPVEQAGHEPGHALELLEHRAHLVPGQDDR